MYVYDNAENLVFLEAFEPASFVILFQNAVHLKNKFFKCKKGLKNQN